MKNLVIGTAAWFLSIPITRDVTVPYIGVPINVMVAVAIGTYCAFAIAKDKIEPRRKMWGVAFACFFMGAAFTGIVHWVMSNYTDKVMTDALQAGMGAFVAFCTRFFLPWLAEVISSGKWTEYIPFLRKKE